LRLQTLRLWSSVLFPVNGKLHLTTETNPSTCSNGTSACSGDGAGMSEFDKVRPAVARCNILRVQYKRFAPKSGIPPKRTISDQSSSFWPPIFQNDLHSAKY
jgi:hypothetical protein